MKSIDASDNRIVKLSEELGKLQNLEKLCISKNQFLCLKYHLGLDRMTESMLLTLSLLKVERSPSHQQNGCSQTFVSP